MEKEEIRKQVNKILDREISDAEFKGIFWHSSMIGPKSIIAGGMACLLMGTAFKTGLPSLALQLVL